MAVAVEVFRVIHAPMNFGQFCARWAGVMVVLGVVDEVLPGVKVVRRSLNGFVDPIQSSQVPIVVNSLLVKSKLIRQLVYRATSAGCGIFPR